MSSKPLCIIFLGIDRCKEEYTMYPSIHTYIESFYDIMYVSLQTENVKTAENIQHQLKTVLAKIQNRGVPKLVLAHSFGCIFALHILAEFQSTKIQFLCIDPTTSFTRGYAEFISRPLAEFLDCVPKPPLNSVHVISYEPKGPLTEKKRNYIHKRESGILGLFSEKTRVNLEYIYKETGKYTAHDIHLNYPEVIMRAIKTS
jgi:hypothetical protein